MRNRSGQQLLFRFLSNHLTHPQQHSTAPYSVRSQRFCRQPSAPNCAGAEAAPRRTRRTRRRSLGHKTTPCISIWPAYPGHSDPSRAPACGAAPANGTVASTGPSRSMLSELKITSGVPLPCVFQFPRDCLGGAGQYPKRLATIVSSFSAIHTHEA